MGIGVQHALIVFVVIIIGIPALMGAVFLAGRGNKYSLYSADFQIRNAAAGTVLGIALIIAFFLVKYLIELVW